MNHNHFRHLSSVSSISLLIFCAALMGCKGEKATEISLDQENGATTVVVPDSVQTPLTSVATSTSTVDPSPVTSGNQLPTAATGPAEICSKFLSLLRSGNRITAEQLLTRKALTVTNQAQLELEAMGSDQAKYSFADVRFATNKRKLAYVDCTISDVVDGKPAKTSITWLVKTQNEGWRISGILLEVSPDQPKNLLSFENYEDVARIKGSLAEDVQETHTLERRAATDNSTIK